MQPVPLFAATGGDPLAWGDDEPISYTFIKKGLGKDRVEEMLRVINWCSAPFGTKEFDLREYGVEGKHHTSDADRPGQAPIWASRRSQNQYFFISGRSPVVQPTPDDPELRPRPAGLRQRDLKYLEKDPWDGMKLEMPAKYKAAMVPTEDKITDMRPRPPSAVATSTPWSKEWRAGGGDEARDLLAKALADAGR